MDMSEQKSCIICGIKKPLSAFHHNHGKISGICLNCMRKEDESGGFQVNIIDKLTAVSIEQAAKEAAATEHFEKVLDGLDEQTERSHQDPQKIKKYNTGLFSHEKRGSDTLRTPAADTKNMQKQVTESTNKQDTQKSDKSELESSPANKTDQTTSTRIQNNLFSNKQPSNRTEQASTVSQNNAEHSKSSDTSTPEKAAAAATRSSLFGITLPDTKPLDDLATRVIQHVFGKR